MKFIWIYVKKYKLPILMSILLIGASVGSILVQPKIMAAIINEITAGNVSSLTGYGLLIVGLAVFGLLAGFLNTVIAARIAQKAGSDIRSDLFDKVQTFSYNNIEKFSASNLVVRLTNDSQQAQNLIMIILQSLIRIPFLLIGSFVLAIRALPQLWWIVILVMALVIFAVMIAFGFMGPKFGKIQMYIERINAIAKENFMGMRVVKSFVQEDSEIAKFTKESEQLTKETIAVGYIFGLLMPTFFLIMDGGSAFVMLLVGRIAEVDPSIIGASVSFVNYLVNVMMALMIGGMMVSFSSRAFVSIARIKEVMDTDADMDFVLSGELPQTGNMRFDNVSFTYEGLDTPSLKNISFEIKENQTIGIVGATGSGKSTLVQLMARIYDPSEGSVYISDIDLKNISKDALRKEIALVLQRPTLFSGTIADNIRQGKQDATYDEMLQAARIAQAENFILAEKGQFEAEVYQRGANFSGGQKQRISIARGIVGKPKLLILDDSTSALDAQSEKRVKEGLIRDLGNTTKVIVSQKISSIVHADTILVLDEGALVAQGTHHELIQTSAIYREIFDTQKGKEIDLMLTEGGIA